MKLRLLLGLVTAISLVSLVAAQDTRRAVFEEIQAVPNGMRGEWTIGGLKLLVDENTRIDRTHPAVVGALAIVQFEIRRDAAVATAIVPHETKAVEVNDGPYVFWRDRSTAEVVMFTAGKPQTTVYTDLAGPRTIRKLKSAESTITLDPTPPAIPQSSWEAPSRLMAISDLEGNYDNTRRFLQNNRVLDRDGNWVWGNGHLVLVGDLVDRGAQVTELMWLLRRLERQAAAAGGQVHYVLGNHEVMVMAGDLRYVNPKYFFVCSRLRQSYNELYDTKSDIGRWWRTRNAVLRIGDLLFVHGGYSPRLDRAGLDMEILNRRVRAGLPPALPMGRTVGTNPVQHQHGPFWYRGYFEDYAAAWGGKASHQEINQILKRHRAKHIVVGHTVVPNVGPLDGTATVIGIDVNWKDPRAGQGLLSEKGKLYRVTMSGKREPLST